MAPHNAVTPPMSHIKAIDVALVVETSWNPSEVNTPVPIMLAITKAEAVIAPSL